MNRTHVAVIFGGMSSEHSISCLSAANVVAAIDRDRYDVSGVGITPDGVWVRYGVDEILDLPNTGQLPVVEVGNRSLVSVTQMPEGACIVDTQGNTDPIQVVFPVLHGPFGEDGTIQGLLEMAGVRYVGCGVAASANCMDKHLTKMILAEAGVLVGPYIVVRDHEWREDRNGVLKAASRLTYPLFVKPARGGSSIGISKVASPDRLEAAIEMARRHDKKVLIEQGIVGREIECSILDGHHGAVPRASVPGEIVVHDPDGFYDFEAKYLTGEQKASVQPRAALDDETRARVQEVATKAFRVLGCEGLARIDTFVTSDGAVYVNEPNTMPGFTRTSGFPLMWQASGMTYAQIVSELIELALERPLGLR
ncbi:D-alanine--D-alanine ligase family protein [Cutibacterium sp.]|uniref:D-alanine--D-alanine ligase family protein n=1 Tax=Cutibacterium sp. TaxID=1912221 RepID=UPI0026DC92DC|nr:D-alanine--D-alanine ligase family protein [Cutibacterium sp.]MDO4412121.1 D-alanine--D-alanine ligase family protein [Cutibacterium sp.]